MDKQTKAINYDIRPDSGEYKHIPARQKKSPKSKKELLPFLEFFAGSGLVAHALKNYFSAIWANDICEKKSIVYCANHGNKNFYLDSIINIQGKELPLAPLAWASFPCQDLSLAGLTAGISGKRSGLVWEWLRVIDEMSSQPSVLVAENVTGLMSIDHGSQYKVLHNALQSRGYRIGAVQLDAIHWVPQSRPRIFIIAIKNSIAVSHELLRTTPNWAHSNAIITAAKDLNDWLWWNLPTPAARKKNLIDIIEWDAECHDNTVSKKNISLIPTKHRNLLAHDLITVAPGYKRTRNSRQVLELRFDGVAGCLRTPKGGSSRQLLVIKQKKNITTRLLTVRETARLMGAPESFKLPGSYNDGYMAMGDAVAAPCARFLAKHLLSLLLEKKNDFSS